MLTRFRNFIIRHDLADPRDRILLAVSGGLDSMVMLDLFSEAGYTIGVAHCNFQLRGKESDQDEELVSSRCKQLEVKFVTQRFETKNYAEQKGISIQMAARNLRYQWFDTVMEDGNYHWLATAHHLNDNIETVLSRWAKGGGLDHLTGIPVKNEKVIRPLLFATREEIQSFAAEKNIKWREDSSNASDDYQRNFIRHEVIPKLKEINPSLEETFNNSLEKIQGAYEIMQRGLGQLKDSITRSEGERLLLDKNLLKMLQHPAFVCYEWLRPFGFDWDRCVQLVNAIDAQPGKQFSSSTHLAVIDREHIIVSPIKEMMTEIFIEEGQDKAALGPWILKLKTGNGKTIQAKRETGSFDRGKIKFPMLWRKWRHGDSFSPLGLGGNKKVSDFLIDEKISLTDKNDVTVLESGGEIVWIVGHRVDDRFKVTTQSKSVLEIAVVHI